MEKKLTQIDWGWGGGGGGGGAWVLSECLSVTLMSHTPGEEEQDSRDKSKYFSLSQTLGQEQVSRVSGCRSIHTAVLMREVVGGGHDAGAGVANSTLLPDVKHLLNGFLEAHEVVVYQPCRHKAPLGNHTHHAASHCGNPPLLRPVFQACRHNAPLGNHTHQDVLHHLASWKPFQSPPLDF